MCKSSGVHEYTHEGVTKEFHVNLTSTDKIFDICGYSTYTDRPARACILDRYYIYVTPGLMCPNSMAHELSHGFGMDFVDRPMIGHR